MAADDLLTGYDQPYDITLDRYTFIYIPGINVKEWPYIF